MVFVIYIDLYLFGIHFF